VEGAAGISWFPCSEFPCVPEVSESAEPSGFLRSRSCPYCLPLRLTASTLHSIGFRSSILSPHVPLSNASRHTVRCAPHDSGSGRFATPCLYDSFIHNSLPVSPALRDELVNARMVLVGQTIVFCRLCHFPAAEGRLPIGRRLPTCPTCHEKIKNHFRRSRTLPPFVWDPTRAL
jgi:hypothetical protein